MVYPKASVDKSLSNFATDINKTSDTNARRNLLRVQLRPKESMSTLGTTSPLSLPKGFKN